MRAVPSPLPACTQDQEMILAFMFKTPSARMLPQRVGTNEVAIKINQHGTALQLNAISPIAKNLSVLFFFSHQTGVQLLLAILPHAVQSKFVSVRISREHRQWQLLQRSQPKKRPPLGVTIGTSGVLTSYPPKLTESISTATDFVFPQREPRKGINAVVIAVAAVVCLFVGIVLRLREGGNLGARD